MRTSRVGDSPTSTGGPVIASVSCASVAFGIANSRRETRFDALTLASAAVTMLATHRGAELPSSGPNLSRRSESTPMSFYETETEPTREEIAWELVALFDELEIEQLNEMLAKNVPMETLEFFASYANNFSDTQAIHDRARKQVPNLLLLGYLLRILEERLLTDQETFDA
jgi:hypothetical protein